MNEYFQNYEIYVGDNPDYTQNSKCEGGPFMRTDDPTMMNLPTSTPFPIIGVVPHQREASGSMAKKFGATKRANTLP